MTLESLVTSLRTGVHHVTNLSNYQLILSTGSIRHNDGKLPFSFGESSLSNCYELGAISLFDFETPSTEYIFDTINQTKWETVLFRHRPAILLGVRRSDLPGKLIEYAEAKRRRGLGGIIPHIEVCHIGAIPLSAIFQTILATRSDTIDCHTEYMFQRYDGFRIPEADQCKYA